MTLAPVNIRSRIIPILALVKIPPRIIRTLALVKIHSHEKNHYFFFNSWFWYQWINWQKYIFPKTCKIFISMLSIFFVFIFFGFFGLGPAQPTWAGLGWTQPARPGHWPKPVTRLGNMKHAWTKSRVQIKEVNPVCLLESSFLLESEFREYFPMFGSVMENKLENTFQCLVMSWKMSWKITY